METTTPTTPPTAAEKAAERRPVLERIVTQLHSRKHKRLAKQCIPNWKPEELAKVQPYGDRVKAKDVSYYRACMELMPLLPGRSFEAIRKKLKNWVNYGRFN